MEGGVERLQTGIKHLAHFLGQCHFREFLLHVIRRLWYDGVIVVGARCQQNDG